MSIFLIGLFIFILGACLGSFLNVIIYRYNTGMPIAWSRSQCMHCGKKLKWYELVPLISFAIQKGRCRHCKARLSFQYPFVEAITGVLFVMLFFMLGTGSLTLTWTGILFVYFAFQWLLLTAIYTYDLKHKIIPDLFVYLFAGLALVINMYIHPGLNTLLAGPAVALPILMMWLFSRGKAMGFGDVKLALGIGWFLGLAGGYAALILGFWLGGIAGILIILTRKRGVSLRSEVPFAPFLITGMAMTFFGGIGLVEIMNLFNFLV